MEKNIPKQLMHKLKWNIKMYSSNPEECLREEQKNNNKTKTSSKSPQNKQKTKGR
jgi:hypothetical protein